MHNHKRKELKNITKLSIQQAAYIVVKDEIISSPPTHIYLRVYNCTHPIDQLYLMMPRDYSLPPCLGVMNKFNHPNILSRMICADGVELREGGGVSVGKTGMKEQGIWDCLKDLLSGIEWIEKQEANIKQSYMPLSLKNIVSKAGVYKIGTANQSGDKGHPILMAHHLGVIIYELCYNKTPTPAPSFPPYSNAGDSRSESLRDLLARILLSQTVSLSDVLRKITLPQLPVLIPNEEEAMHMSGLTHMLKSVSERQDRSVWLVQDAVEWEDIGDHFMECNYRRILLISSLREVQKVIQECLDSTMEGYALVGVNQKEFNNLHQVYPALLKESESFISNIEYALRTNEKKEKTPSNFLLLLYDAIIDYPQYSVSLQRLMRMAMGLLVDIYDMGLKDESNYHSDPDDSRTPMDQLIRSRCLTSYIYYLRKVKSEAVEVRDVLTQMCLMGLHIL